MSGKERDQSMHIGDSPNVPILEPRPRPANFVPCTIEDSSSTSVEASRVYCPLSIDDAPSNERSLFTIKFTKSEMDMLQNEKSRTVKIFFLKFKCIIVFAVLLVAFFQFLYICFREFMTNDHAFQQAFKLLQTLIISNSSALNSSSLDKSVLFS